MKIVGVLYLLFVTSVFSQECANRKLDFVGVYGNVTVCAGDKISEASMLGGGTISIQHGTSHLPTTWSMVDGYTCQVIYSKHGTTCFDRIEQNVMKNLASYLERNENYKDGNRVKINGQDGECYTGQHYIIIEGASTEFTVLVHRAYAGEAAYCQLQEYKQRFIFFYLWIGIALIIIVFIVIFAVILSVPSLLAYGLVIEGARESAQD